MAALAGGHLRHLRGRTLRQTQTSTGDGNGRALMNTDSETRCVVHGSNRGGVGWIDLNDLHTGTKCRRLDISNSLVVREAGEHAGAAGSFILQSRLFLHKLEALDDKWFARSPGGFDGLFHGIAKDGLGLPLPLAVGNTRNVLAADEVAVAVHFREHELSGIDVDADRTQASVRNPCDPYSFR